MLTTSHLTKDELIKRVRLAGVVGAGGAGFPTHVKLNARAEVVIANGAECEPLLRVDQSLMENAADRLVLGMGYAMLSVGATQGVIATKKHYLGAVEAISKAIQGLDGLSLHLMESYYPAGDEKSLIHEVTGKVVPSAKLPADYGCVVLNIGTLLGIADAVESKPVTDKMVTVCGDVRQPLTRLVPVGTSIRALVKSTGSSIDEGTHCVIEGGPLMGKLRENWDLPITKTTGGLVVLPRNHPLILKTGMAVERQVKLAMAVCCQCNMCTIMCPRHALGLGVEPHKAMRAIANGNSALLGDVNGVLACCSCNLCTHYACNFGLTPGTVMTNLKNALQKAGVRPVTEENVCPDPSLETKRIPLSRLLARMGLSKYNTPALFVEEPLTVKEVELPFSQHIGQPAKPVVKTGERVRKGQLVADVEENKLGSPIHASIDGVVNQVTQNALTIRGQEE